MLKEFAQYLEEQHKPMSAEIGSETYIVGKDGLMTIAAFKAREAMEQELMKRSFKDKLEEPLPDDCLQVTTLTGIVDYLTANPDEYITPKRKAIVQIKGATEVNVFCQMNHKNERPYILQAKAITPDIRLGSEIMQEQFIIMLQSQFAPTKDRDTLLRIVGNLKEGAEKEMRDNGMAQTVIVKKGVATVDGETVPNPAILAPFRTFIEVEQPRSYYVCRLHESGRISLTDASGGEWRIQAIQSIKEWFKSNLPQKVLDNTHILA